jgi:hypothetical protein
MFRALPREFSDVLVAPAQCSSPVPVRDIAEVRGSRPRDRQPVSRAAPKVHCRSTKWRRLAKLHADEMTYFVT